MGRGDNRKTRKMRRRKGWRQKKARFRNLIEAVKSGTAPKAKAKKAGSSSAASAATVRRTADGSSAE